jgi:hypothetical protein
MHPDEEVGTQSDEGGGAEDETAASGESGDGEDTAAADAD